MYNSYIIRDKKICALDEKGNQATSTAYSNSGKLLEKLNYLSTIKNNIKENNKKIENNKESVTYQIFYVLLLTLCIEILISLIFSGAFGYICTAIILSIFEIVLISDSIFAIKKIKIFKKLNNLLKEEERKERKNLIKLEKERKPVLDDVNEYKMVPTEMSDNLNKFNKLYVEYSMNKKSYFRKFQKNKLTKHLLDLGYNEEQINTFYELLYNDFQSKMDENTIGVSKKLTNGKKY